MLQSHYIRIEMLDLKDIWTTSPRYNRTILELKYTKLFQKSTTFVLQSHYIRIEILLN